MESRTPRFPARERRHASQSILQSSSSQTRSPNHIFRRKATKKKRLDPICAMCIVFFAPFLFLILLQRSFYEDVSGGAIQIQVVEKNDNAIRSSKLKKNFVAEGSEDHQQPILHHKITDTPNIVIQSKQPKDEIHSKHPPDKYSLGLQFIHPKELGQKDFFSDSWLINRQRFLEIDETRIKIVEDAVFVVVGTGPSTPYSHSKMLYTWNDFCVEHLSKWWGMLKILQGGDPGHIFDHVIGMLERYMTERVRPPPNVSSTDSLPLHKTIAMIAFSPYKAHRKEHDPDGEKGRKLTAYSLAATIASLYQVGFGRVVVVGLNDHDMPHVQDAVNILLPIFNGQKAPRDKNNGHDESYLVRLGTTSMEIAFVQVTEPKWYFNGKVARNVPRAAIVGMQRAMNQQLNGTETSKWLGSRNNAWKYWNNIYLTEPDTILHIPQGLLAELGEALRKGIALFPHRLHPLPHESDLPTNHSLNPGLYLHNIGHFANISTISTSTDTQNDNGIDELSTDFVSCCDDGGLWPWRDDWKKPDKCGSWWDCGFRQVAFDRGEKFNETEFLEKNRHLQLYPMMAECGIFVSMMAVRKNFCTVSVGGRKIGWHDLSATDLRYLGDRLFWHGKRGPAVADDAFTGRGAREVVSSLTVPVDDKFGKIFAKVGNGVANLPSCLREMQCCLSASNNPPAYAYLADIPSQQ
ncbi:hypothetical protein IV203_023306 [Nitzschia inconspicua]|uniref:Uncharacterized protein n=1 Tax=Nitzschia inconspicua TaxID=303405 RepID=A0A9K3KDX1_9STRA|nr:hypothetical protein IV203_023306 [Nitzschia inconspicua]